MYHPGVQGYQWPGSVFFPNARNFILENPSMNYNVQGENDKVTWGKEDNPATMMLN